MIQLLKLINEHEFQILKDANTGRLWQMKTIVVHNSRIKGDYYWDIGEGLYREGTIAQNSINDVFESIINSYNLSFRVGKTKINYDGTDSIV